MEETGVACASLMFLQFHLRLVCVYVPLSPTARVFSKGGACLTHLRTASICYCARHRMSLVDVY